MKKLFPVLSLALVFAACGGGKTETVVTDSTKVVVDSTKKDTTKMVIMDSTMKDSTKK